MKILIPPIKNLLAAPFASQKNKKTRKKQQQFGFQKIQNAFRTPGMYRFFSPPRGVVFHNKKKVQILGASLEPSFNSSFDSSLRFGASFTPQNFSKGPKRSRSQVSQSQSPESWSCCLKGKKNCLEKHLGKYH